MVVESFEESGKSLAAPTIFVVVLVFHVCYKYIELWKKKKLSMSDSDIQLQAEIKQLLREANSSSQPSTFAQAAKLRRQAAAKEKELAKNQELHGKDIESSFGIYKSLIMISQIITYIMLIIWFWNTTITTISNQLVKPFGSLLSWKAGSGSSYVAVGIIPWLFVSTRVSKFICRKVWS